MAGADAVQFYGEDGKLVRTVGLFEPDRQRAA
jgi:hypothetical protein